MELKYFFSKWFYISIILILIGLFISDISSANKLYQYLYHLAAGLFQSIGIAILVANIFSFVIGTEKFMQYIRERLVSIVISKEFVTKLNPDEQRSLLHMVLRPTKEFSAIYSGITDYFNQYIEDSMRLFDSCYRGHMFLDAVASYSDEKNCIQVEFDLDYIVYKVADTFEPIKLGLEDESSEHIQTTIRGPGGLDETLTNEDAEEIGIDDPTMKQMMQLQIPDKFNALSHVNVSRKIVEYGSDHWQVFSYKTIKACDQLTVSLRCKEGLIIRNCSTYGVQNRYTIEKDDSRIKVTYNDWLSPGFGVNIVVAKRDFH